MDGFLPSPSSIERMSTGAAGATAVVATSATVAMNDEMPICMSSYTHMVTGCIIPS